jgi:hypothetical protein
MFHLANFPLCNCPNHIWLRQKILASSEILFTSRTAQSVQWPRHGLEDVAGVAAEGNDFSLIWWLIGVPFSRYRHSYSGIRRSDHEVDLCLSLEGEVQNERSHSFFPWELVACTRVFYLYTEDFAMKEVKFVYDIRKKSRIYCSLATLLFLCCVIYEIALMEFCLSVS